MNGDPELTKKDKMAINDKAVILNQMTQASGLLIGPLVGGSLSEKYGFEKSCAIMAWLYLANSFIFWLFGICLIK
jgi:MFS family permease